jgi:MFS family permease
MQSVTKKNIKGPFGIYYGWVIVTVAFLIGITQAGVFQNILSIFMIPMAAEFGWNRSLITGAIAVGSLAGGFAGPVVGPILDRQGSRMMAFYGISILSAGLIVLAWMSSLWQLYLFFGMGRMISAGLLNLIVTVSVSNWFIKKRGRAMGMAQLGSRIGLAVLPPLVQIMITGVGWRMAWAMLGLIVFCISAIPSIIFLRRRPEDIGLLPDGETPVRSGKIKPADLLPETELADEPLDEEKTWSRQQIFQTRSFWQLIVISCVIFFVGAGTNFHIFPFLTDNGLSPETSVMVISVIWTLSAFGAVIIGFLAEKIPVKLLLAVSMILLGVIFSSIFWVVTNVWMVFAFAVIYGFVRGALLPLLYLMWVEFFGRYSSGTALGLSSIFRYTANALGPVFAAICFDLQQNYLLPFYLFSGLLVIGGLVSTQARAPIHSDQPGCRM